VFRTLLKLVGIKHLQTQLCAPWQNGRIERLFGTLKPLLKQLVLPNSTALEMALREFKLFYNNIRPHQNLNGLTPAEVWQGMTMADLKKSEPVLMQALDGLLVGYYLRR
jgi:putative transposase